MNGRKATYGTSNLCHRLRNVDHYLRGVWNFGVTRVADVILVNCGYEQSGLQNHPRKSELRAVDENLHSARLDCHRRVAGGRHRFAEAQAVGANSFYRLRHLCDCFWNYWFSREFFSADQAVNGAGARPT